MPDSREDLIIQGFSWDTPDILRGDDAAEFKVPHAHCVVSQDTLCEDVHFDLSFCRPTDIAHRVIHANLSDMAAMGLYGQYVLQSLAIPKSLSGEWLTQYTQAFNHILAENQLHLIGGDTCLSRHGVTITLTIMTYAPPHQTISRHRAKPGDIIAISKLPGQAMLGLNALKRQAGFEQFHDFFLKPQADNHLATLLKSTGTLHAMIDTSDGLYQDLQRLSQCSQVGIEIDIDQIPCTDEFITACKTMHLDPVQLQLTGGEDYGLLFAADPSILSFQNQYHFYPIGHVTDTQSIQFIKGGQDFQLEDLGYTHFD